MRVYAIFGVCFLAIMVLISHHLILGFVALFMFVALLRVAPCLLGEFLFDSEWSCRHGLCDHKHSEYDGPERRHGTTVPPRT